jgi:hypothetical protein
LCDFTEPVTTPRKVEEHGENKMKKKVEEHGENKMKKIEEHGENKVKRKEGDKKVMSKSQPLAYRINPLTPNDL